MSAPATWFFRFERLINLSAFSLFFAEGRVLYGITAGAQVIVKEFESDRDASSAIIHILAEIERNEDGNKSSENNPAA